MRLITVATLCVIASSEQLTADNVVGSLREMLDQVVASGDHRNYGLVTGRKMIIENMLQKVSMSEGKFDPSAKAFFGQASTILAEVITMLFTARNDLQAFWDEFPGKFDVCDAQNQASKVSTVTPVGDDALFATAATQRTTLGECWQNAKGLMNDVPTECSDAAHFITSTWDNNGQNPRSYGCCMREEAHTGECTGNSLATTQENAGEWMDQINQGKAFFEQSNYDLLSAAKTQCDTAVTSLQQKLDNECRPAQTTYQSGYCAGWCRREERCSIYHGCYAGHNADVQAATAKWTTQDAQRPVDAKVTYLVKCLIDGLRDVDWTDFNAWLASCQWVRDNDFSNFTTTFAQEETAATCDTSDLVYGTGNNLEVNWGYTVENFLFTKAQWLTTAISVAGETCTDDC